MSNLQDVMRQFNRWLAKTLQSIQNRRNIPAEEDMFRIPTHVSSLPSNVLETIFNMLPVKDKGAVALVCTEWRNTCYKLTSWQRDTFACPRNLNLRINPTLFASIKSRGICKVSMSIDDDADDTLLSEVLRSFPNLVQMTLEFQSFNRKLALDPQLRSKLPADTQFSIFNYNIMDNEMKNTISRNLRNLTHLTMDKPMNDKYLQLIARDFGTITHLHLTNCNHVTDAGIGHLAGRNRHPTDASLLTLEYLALENCPGLTDTAMLHLRAGQPLLRHVQLSRNTNVTEEGLFYLTSLSYLNELHLVEVGGIIEMGGIKLLIGNGSLRVLKLEGVRLSRSGLQYLDNTILIRHLQVHRCSIRRRKASYFQCIYEIHM